MVDVILSPDGQQGGEPVVPITAFTAARWEGQSAGVGASAIATARLAGFRARAGELVQSPDTTGALAGVLFGLGESAAEASVWRAAAARLPAGLYRIDAPDGASLDPQQAERIALAWALGSYRYDRYKRERSAPAPRLIAPAGVRIERVKALAAGCALARDMVNTPANDMGPRQIETIAREIAHAHGAEISVVVGEALLEAGYPAVHAVGRAAAPDRAPRMIEITWAGSAAGEGAPLVALVGKGVAFDTGGLDLKPSSAMRLMKKDMGGAAHALGLARMIMALDLPLRLAVLVPAVENAVSGDAMRPGDVLASRAGLSIEVGNTDAEGRLILADALTRAGELEPDLTIDLATLTGAARVALGPQVIPFYTADDALAGELAAASAREEDPLWRMPLWSPYAAALDSDIADLKNDPDAWAQAGSVTAALFLQRFAPKGPWIHLDIFAWNPRGRPGWPAGAEAQTIRALLALIEARWA